MEIQNFKIEDYDPAKSNDAQLADDWRLVCGKYSTMLRGGKTEFDTVKDCQDFAVVVLREILNRNKITFHPQEMKPTSLDLLRDSLSKLVSRGLYLVAPHGEWFYSGKKKAMVKSVVFESLKNFHILCSEDKAYGYIRFETPERIDLKEFSELRPAHQISETERKEWWPDKEVLFFYDLRDFIPFEKPLKTEVPKGVQVFVDKVVLHSAPKSLADRLPWLIRNAEDLPEFVWKPDFVSLTGSMIFADRHPNDADVVIRAKDVDAMLTLKLQRAIAYHFDNPDIHWILEEAGPNWPFLPVYDLVLRPKKDLRVIEPEEPQFKKELYHQRAASEEVLEEAKKSREEDKLKLFRFYLGIKPTRITLEGKRQTVDRFVSYFADDDFPVLNSKKYDGMRILIFKEKNRVEIWSEDGVQATHRLPDLCEDVKKLKGKNFIIEAELEKWLGKVHQPREAVAGDIHSRRTLDASAFIANVYTCLFLNGEDLHKKTEEERQKALDELSIDYAVLGVPDVKGHNLNKVPNVISRNKEELKKSTEKLRFLLGSEGVVAKKAKSIYYLDGNAREGWVKFHNNAVLKGKVSEVLETKVAGTFNYAYGILPGDFKIKKADLVEVGGEDLAEVGRTFSTAVSCQRGDLIEVEFETFNLVHDKRSDTWRVSAWAPVFLRRLDSRGDPDTIEDVVDKAKEEHCLQEKIIIEEEETVYLSHSAEDPYLINPDEAKEYSYVIQHHYRGKSAHCDFRMETDQDYLIGWTMMDGIPGEVKKEVLTLEDAKKYNAEDIWKIDWKEGKVKQRKIRGGIVRPADIRAVEKAPEPVEWLKVEGVTKPGTVGATKEFPGVFSIIDKGTIEFGAQKPYFHEYFISKGKLKGRLCFRMIGREEEKESTLAMVLPPGVEEERPRVPYYWVLLQPLEQAPYVLSKGAIEKDWLPPKDTSALPKSIRKNVPDKLKFWKMTGEKALEARKELAGMEEMTGPEIQHSDDKATFVLQRHWFRGPIIIRFGPSHEHWDLRILSEGKMWHLVLKNDPLSGDTMGYEKPCKDLETMKSGKEKTEELEPGTPLNPTKDTPAFIRALDWGNCVILESGATFKKIDFKGKELKGLFAFTREAESDFWTMVKSSLPETKT